MQNLVVFRNIGKSLDSASIENHPGLLFAKKMDDFDLRSKSKKSSKFLYKHFNFKKNFAPFDGRRIAVNGSRRNIVSEWKPMGWIRFTPIAKI